MKLVSKEIEERIREERRTVTGVKCDICNEIYRYTYLSNGAIDKRPKYFEVITGHHDWGNDSHESIQSRHVCPDCISGFVSKYLSEANGTEYIDIETHYCWPEKVNVDWMDYDDRQIFRIDEKENEK